MTIEAPRDFFADIATADYSAQRTPLEHPPVPEIPELLLEWESECPVPRKRAPKLQTAEEVERELQALREQYAPFLADLAPALQSPRSRLELKTFDWRVEEPEDQRNFLSAMEGGGKWETIDLPHYRPPLGKAATLYRFEF
ncbi:MAG: hypothetical protein AB3N33_12880 [Puniceicoccaceae bacterium]